MEDRRRVTEWHCPNCRTVESIEYEVENRDAYPWMGDPADADRRRKTR